MENLLQDTPIQKFSDAFYVKDINENAKLKN